ncbi:uncharacterized protein Dwil_GK10752 [Drosophila willistoni]|uniref:Serendipity locus protein alpha n=1 Tax=Drosophila willistoni TaxID=7260 RepID=B4MIY9_DROWI|nr:serendipity locus protein alpha [Drosophila willistoni]EDW72078.1 uncharacterized protein Dwil_GK10752 [Drosophila willistoni]
MNLLRAKLENCLLELSKCSDDSNKRMNWLNNFCAALLEFSSAVHKYMSIQNEAVELICLCLTQIMICIRQLENIVKVEKSCDAKIAASHHHFVERARWCLKRMLRICPDKNSKQDELVLNTEGQSFLDLVDSILDTLAPFSNYNEENSYVNVSEILSCPKDTMHLCRRVGSSIDSVLSQTLSFANVALQEDKRALSALCQKVMREFGAFQAECQTSSSASNIKLKTMTMEQALYQLEDFINEALLRLVFQCFLDTEKFSVDKIRNVLRQGDTSLSDDFIADFDVNIDRAMQIGVFAVAFAPNLKMKTIVRSCLASFESLDTSLIPSLQASGTDLHSEILEQHFNEEMMKFKTAMHEIIDSGALVGCYLDILTDGIQLAEKNFKKTPLMDLNQMAMLLLEHFQLTVNEKVLKDSKCGRGVEYFQQFVRMWRECKAILMCAAQVEPQRIIKRFKIMRSILRKLHSCLQTGTKEEMPQEETQQSLAQTNEAKLDLSGILPSQTSILYDTRERRSRNQRQMKPVETETTKENTTEKNKSMKSTAYASVRRRESLRTQMFKRQNIAESRKRYKSITNNQSVNLQISDILDQLTDLSSTFSETQHLLNKK